MFSFYSLEIFIYQDCFLESSDALLGEDLYEAIHKDEFLNYVNTIKQNDYDALSRDFKV